MQIKEYLIQLFEVLEIDSGKRQELQNSTLSTQNLVHFFGILEEKGLSVINQYSQIVAE